jgi:preprotein translocase subunit SecA
MQHLELARVMPIPGPMWGRYPMRPSEDASVVTERWQWRSDRRRIQRIADSAQAHADAWHRCDAASRARSMQALRSSLRSSLRRDGLQADVLAQALGMVSIVAAETLGWTPRETQLLAAAALLEGRLAEMATGEGKTLAVALAASVAALAGIPVHVVTANDYLAARDAARLAPLFNALGLRAAALAGATTELQRRTVYTHDIVYATAKDLGFDFLRDRLNTGAARELDSVAASLGGQNTPTTLMRGLCMALLDEADSILLDEAEVPLILSRAAPQLARRSFLWQALALARRLEEARDFDIDRADRRALLTTAGEVRLAELTNGLGGPWQRPRYRREAVLLALAALHAYRRDEHYVVRDERIELLDEVTGRVAQGRVWSRGLQTVMSLKENLSVPPETETIAQITFQRLFQSYWRLCGISGTLWEARTELRDVYGMRVVRIPLHRRCLRRELAARCFEHEPDLARAIVERVGELRNAGRPVLIGTDSVADSLRLSQWLSDRGIDHRVLNALQDADEAAIVAQAGCSRSVTVATRLAGRGTDIELDEPARAAGGLHVLSCQDNPSKRLDRQLAGRAGRHGDPGSTETWFLPRNSALREPATADNAKTWIPLSTFDSTPWLAKARRNHSQWREERRRAELRRNLMEQDREWERRLSFAGSAR